MPGLPKIGRTDRQPELRARELHTTGVPQPFFLEHSVRVTDSVLAETQAHALLQSKGARMSQDREFFNTALSEAIEVLDIVSSPSIGAPDFSRLHELASLAAASALSKPAAVCFEEAEIAANRLASIGRRGYPGAMCQAATIFEEAHPHGPRFKDLWREYLQLERAFASWIPLASSNGLEVRFAVGRGIAEYVDRFAKHHWLTDEDFAFILEFLVAGDQFQYEGYLQELTRYALPEQVAERARSL